MKRFGCVLRAIKNWIRFGVFSGHVYVLNKTVQSNVFYTDSTFRISDSMEHSADEKLAAGAYVEISRCKYCGHKDISWIRKENYEVT